VQVVVAQSSNYHRMSLESMDCTKKHPEIAIALNELSRMLAFSVSVAASDLVRKMKCSQQDVFAHFQEIGQPSDVTLKSSAQFSIMDKEVSSKKWPKS
jgi:hypothetical protein